MAAASPIRVLYAEDSAFDADLVAERLRQCGSQFALEIAPDGAAFRDRLAAQEFDVFLVDQRLPDTEGVELVRAVTQRNSAAPVVMVTGMGDEATVVDAIRAGAYDYISKDGDWLESLPEALERAVRAADEGTTIAARTRPRRILYAEHHEHDVELTRAAIAELALPIAVEAVGSCDAALKALVEDVRGFDALLVDLRMPDMSGLDLMRKLRAEGIVLPCVIVTGQGDELTALAALRLGAYDYIVKREGYLVQLPIALENAISRFRADVANGKLTAQLRELNTTLEDRVEQRTEELARKTAELGTFIYAASHDLRAPLVTIGGFAGVGREALQEGDKGEALAAFTEIEGAVQQMSSFVSRLLDAARAGETTPRPERVRVARLFKAARSRLASTISACGGEVELRDELGELYADPLMVIEVLQNLIDNGLKYRREGHPPTVTVDARRDGDRATIIVSDNGRGIRPSYRSRVFDLFERGSADVPGSGVGLTIARRFARANGGDVTLGESARVGSVFMIDLPLREEREH